MTPAGHWPDLSNPGLPPEPDQDGDHVLLTDQAKPTIARWSAALREWWLPGSALSKSPEWAAAFCGYLSRVHLEADLTAAYRRGVADGREAAMATIKEAADTAVRQALRQRDADVAAARREGAADMRRRAAEIATTTDLTLLATRFSMLRDDAGALKQWHRRLHAEAIHELPLPDSKD